jgi:sugar lactone lactonase YvrE
MVTRSGRTRGPGAATLLTLALFSCADRPSETADPASTGPVVLESGSATVLVQGAALHSANGIHFDSEGRLWVASVFGRELVALDPESGAVVHRYGPADGVETPDDVAIAEDGSVYWTAIFTGEVGRIGRDGEKRGQFVAPGVNPITFSDDGRLFVALDFFGDGLYELDPALVQEPRMILEAPGWMNGMDWGPDGLVYGPIWTRGSIVRVDPGTGATTTVADGFNIVSAVKFDSRGRLYATEYTTGEVWRIDVGSGEREVVGRVPPAPDNLALDSTDRLFVSHARDGSVYEIMDESSTRLVSPGGMIAPGGLALSPGQTGGATDGTLYVADLLSLRAFDPESGEAMGVETHFIGDPAAVIAPMTVHPDGNGNLVITSWVSNAVQVWDPRTRTAIATYADFATPLNAVGIDGDLVVAEMGAGPGDGRLIRFRDGDPGARDTLATGLGVPAGIAVHEGSLWITDRSAGKVLKVLSEGEPNWTPLPVAIGLSAPEGITLAPDGSLLVVETGRRQLVRIPIGSAEVEAVATGLAVGLEGPATAPPTWVFSDVVTDQAGTIFVTGDRDNVVYRIRRDR